MQRYHNIRFVFFRHKSDECECSFSRFTPAALEAQRPQRIIIFFRADKRELISVSSVPPW